MINLDKIDLSKADPNGMLVILSKFPQMLEEGFGIGDNFALPSYLIKCKKVLFLGMGASGIVGRIICDLFSQSSVIFHSVSGYDLPGWVDSETLIIAISHSGNTEETLFAFASAYLKKAKLLAITTGGQLENLCKKYNAGLIKYEFNSEPKLAFFYLFAISLSILSRLFLLGDEKIDVEKTIILLNRLENKISNSSPLAVNPAKDLAVSSFGKTILVISSTHLTSVGVRLSQTINENGKNLSFFADIPELNHNLIAGFENPRNLPSLLFVILVESPKYRPEIKNRFNLLAKFLSSKKISYFRLDFPPCDKFSEIAEFVTFSEYFATYLAFLNQVDPLSADTVLAIKKELGGTK